MLGKMFISWIGEDGEGKSILNMSPRVFTLEKKQAWGGRFQFLWAQRGDIMLGKTLECSAKVRSRAQAEKGLWQGPGIGSRSHPVSAALSTGYCPALLWILRYCIKPMGSLHSCDTEINLPNQFPCLHTPQSHFISRIGLRNCVAPQPPEIFAISIFLALILSFLMVYPSGYHRDIM